MSGDDLLDGSVFGVAIASILFLSWCLFGPEIAIIFGGIIALGIALNQTPPPKRKRAYSRKTSRPLPSSPSKSLSEGVTVRRKAGYTRRNAIVIPDSPEWFPRPPKRRSKHLAAVQRSLSFDGEL